MSEATQSRPCGDGHADGDRIGQREFVACAGLALAIHVALLFAAPGLQGGADLLPHLRLIQLMGGEPSLRSVYAPAYHALGALASPLVGLERYPRLFALLAAAAWIAAARLFQRSFGLPSATACLLVLAPYSFCFSWCIPKVEALGIALVLTGLSLLARARHLGLAALVGATFYVHTASALLLGFSCGVLALARRDHRALLFLAVGALLGGTLTLSHVVAGCSFAEALRLTSRDYLIANPWSSWAVREVVLILASPLTLGLALLGAPGHWRRQRSLAVLSLVLVVVYLNEIWLAPFGRRISLDLLRGLSVLAIPVAIAGGMALHARPRLAPWLLGLCAAWAVASSFWIVPRSCMVRPIALEELKDLQVARCEFTWRGPAIQRPRYGIW
jgi:hypothetical protein